MDLFEMSRKWKDLVERAKAKKLAPAEYSSGSTSVFIDACRNQRTGRRNYYNQ
jgi:hypothetical protein